MFRKGIAFQEQLHFQIYQLFYTYQGVFITFYFLNFI